MTPTQRRLISQPIRVLLVDDHSLLREGLKLFLSGFHDIAVHGEAATGMVAVRLAKDMSPDLIVLDWYLPDIRGPNLFWSLREEAPASRVVIYSASREEQMVQTAMKIGADGYLCKSASPEALVEAIRAVASGRRYFPDDLVGNLADRGRNGAFHLKESNSGAMCALTRRELEIARLVAGGDSNLDIAAKLDICEHTVKLHLNSVYRKLGLTSRYQLVLLIHGTCCLQEDHNG